MRTLTLLGVLLLIIGCGEEADPSLEACVACDKSVSVNAKVCPHCGEPNPSPSIREEIAKAEARAEAAIAKLQAQRAKEEQIKIDAESALIDAELLGSEFLTQKGRYIMQLPKEHRLFSMQDLFRFGGDPINDSGRKALKEYRAAVDKVHKGKHANDEEEFKLLDQARAKLANARRAEEAKQQLADVPAAFERMRKEIERLAKERGQLPDEATVVEIAHTMRDPWSLALKYKIIDAKAGKYQLSSAGPDMNYNTADDPKREFQLGKPE